MRSIPPASIVLAALLAVTCCATVSLAQEVILKNDGFVSGGSAVFQGGFAIGEIGASRFLPLGPFPMRVNRVQFLFGPDPTTETITLRIYDDAAGTANPGTELFSGDYDVTGSTTLMQEIDLTSFGVIVTGQFRVGIEFQHDGAPSIARDNDGNIQAPKNFIYTPSIPGWFQSNLFGVSGDWIIRAGVESVVSIPGAPDILTIADVGNDQGKQVRIRFARSSQDASGAGTPVIQYDVLRRVDPLPIAALAARPLGNVRTPAGVLLDGWDYVTSVPAHGDAIYSVVVPTLVDSSVAHGMRRSVFIVRAGTVAPLTYFDSPPDSGYSVDNLPPVPPAAVAANYANGATHIAWSPNGEADLWYYAIHRGSSAGFTPSPGNRIATSGSPAYNDPGPAGRYYKLAAVDVNGNVSGYTLLTPQSTTGVPDAALLAFALSSAGPNPIRDGRVRLSVTLPSGAPASLELIDVGGRRVASRDISALGVGEHAVELTAGRRLAPGIYLVRLRQGDDERALRVAVTQ